MIFEVSWRCPNWNFWCSTEEATKETAEAETETAGPTGSRRATEAATVVNESISCWSEARNHISSKNSGFTIFTFIHWGDVGFGLFLSIQGRKIVLNIDQYFVAVQVLQQFKEKALKRAGLVEEDVTNLIEARTEARKNKEFAKSDQIRADLSAKGIALMDLGKETIWRPCVPVESQQPAQTW